MDVFNDSTGITSLTNVDRTSVEYVASVYSQTTNVTDGIGGLQMLLATTITQIIQVQMV